LSLRKKLTAFSLTEFSGTVYRIFDPEHGAQDTTGSFLGGGRWNRKGQYGALYTSLERSTAEREIAKQARDKSLRPSDLGQRDCVELSVRIARVLDLSSSSAFERLGVTRENLILNKQICLEIADAAREMGAEAMLVPSATGTGTNLVVFVDLLQQESKIVEVNRESTIRIKSVESAET
jgi:RES domain-containing protein